MTDYFQGFRVHPKLAFRVWQREVTLYKRIWPSTLLSTVFDPLLYLVALGFGLGAYMDDVGGMTYAQFIGPGLVASAIMFGAAYESAWNAYVRMFVERSYEAMMATPASLEDVVAGEVLWGATRSVVMSTIVLGVVTGFGLVTSWWALLIIPFGLLGGVMFTVIGLSYTVGRRHMDQLTFFFTLGVTPMFLFSGVFFPLDGLPQWAHYVALVSPLYHVVVVVRALATGALAAILLVHVAWVAFVTLAFWPLPAKVLRKRLTS